MSRETQVQRLFYEAMTKSQYATPDQRLAAQRVELAKLLRHARERVPFYASRLNPLFTSTGDIDWSKWNEIPLVRRADLIERRESMLPPQLAPALGEITTGQSTGSTGRPVTVSHTAYSAHAAAAARFRGQAWHGLDWSAGFFAWVDNNRGPEHGAEVVEGPVWGPAWLPQATGRAYQMNRYADAGQVLDAIAELRPGYLSARPKVAQYLALEAIRRGTRINLNAVIGFSTAVLPEERDDCLEAFGAPIVNFYSSKEAQLMGFQCPTGTHYHLNDEIVLVEVLDENDQPCRPGQMGRVIVTPFYSFAQPLIRYEQGDLAIAGYPCSCGRTLSTIERIVGQATHLFRFPDGRRVAPQIPERLRRLLNADYWQIAQIAPLEIEVRYVLAPGAEPPLDVAQQVTEIIRARTHPDVNVVLKSVASIANRADGGKFIEYVCELEADAYKSGTQVSVPKFQ